MAPVTLPARTTPKRLLLPAIPCLIFLPIIIYLKLLILDADKTGPNDLLNLTQNNNNSLDGISLWDRLNPVTAAQTDDTETVEPSDNQHVDTPGRVITDMNDIDEPFWSEGRCTTLLEVDDTLGEWTGGKCSSRDIKYLHMIKNPGRAIDRAALIEEAIPPDSGALCHSSGKAKTYKYVNSIPGDCMCEINKHVEPDNEKLLFFAPFNIHRVFFGMVRAGTSVSYLPDGLINHLSAKCLKITQHYPSALHFFRKVDMRFWRYTFIMRGIYISDFEECLPGYKEILKCPGPKHWTTLMGAVQGIANKQNLGSTLGRYGDRVGPTCFDKREHIPLTYTLSKPNRCEEFFRVLGQSRKEENLNQWMIKDSGAHQGKGVEILNTKNYQKWLGEYDNGLDCTIRKNYLVQEYLKNVLLLRSHKFDLRMYLFIASAQPKIAYYSPYFVVRLAAKEYDPNVSDISVSLTNRGVASRLGVSMDDAVMDNDKFAQYFVDNGTFPDTNWVPDTLAPKVKKTMAHLVNLLDLSGKFERTHKLFGVDFLVLDNFDVRLVEVNVGPVLYSEPVDTKIKMTTTCGEILAQLPFLDEISTRTIKAGKFEPIFDETLHGPDRFMGLLDETCDKPLK